MLYLNDLVGFESVPLMLVVIDVDELVAHDSCVADGGVDVRVGMPVNPDVDVAVCDKVA